MAESDSTARRVLEYREERSPGATDRYGMGFLALGASFAVAGLGQSLAGRKRRGLIWFFALLSIDAAIIASFAVPALLPAFLLLAPLGFVAALCNWFDAFLCGHRADAPRFGRAWLNYPIGLLFIAFALIVKPMWTWQFAMALREHVVEAFVVPTASMSPTIVPGDRVLVHKLISPRRWDIVAIHLQNRSGPTFLRRLVGFPGETIEIVNGSLTVNGVVKTTPAGVGPYTSVDIYGQRIGDDTHPNGCEGNPITLGPDEFYFLGDNSPAVLDSRWWNQPIVGHQRGTLPSSSIIGVATWIYWPPQRWKKLR